MLQLIASSAYGWTSSICKYPKVEWMLTDGGMGISSGWKVDGMGSDLYLAGYSAGNLSFVSTNGASSNFVDPNPGTIDMYISQVSQSDASAKKTWYMQSNNAVKNYFGDIHRFPDGKHLAVGGSFRGTLTMPGGTVLTNPLSGDNVAFVFKLDTTATGAAAFVWSKLYAGFPRGSSIEGVDADAAGNMYVSLMSAAVGTTPEMSYGRPTGRMAAVATYHIVKLAAADGAEVWRTSFPKEVKIGGYQGGLRVDASGSLYAVGSLKGSATFGSLPTVTSATATSRGVTGPASSTLVLKLDAAGTVAWAKVLGTGSGGDLDLSATGKTLVVSGSNSATATVDGVEIKGDRKLPGFVAKLEPSSGALVWASSMPGMRGLEVADDDSGVYAFGMVGGSGVSYQLTAGNGETQTLRSRGSYDLFVAMLAAADGAGVWAIDGGGDNTEYFWGFGSDSNGAVYLSGYSRSNTFTFGDKTMTNPMSRGAGGDGQNTVYTIKVSSVTTPPSCIASCGAAPTTGCYIDGQCFPEGTPAPFGNMGCFKCHAAKSQTSWTGPDTSSHCYIGGKCYSPNAKKPGVGYRARPSACQGCDVSASKTAWTLNPKYTLGSGGKCVMKQPPPAGPPPAPVAAKSPPPAVASPAKVDTKKSALKSATAPPSPPAAMSGGTIAGIIIGVLGGIAALVGCFFIMKAQQMPPPEVSMTKR